MNQRKSGNVLSIKHVCSFVLSISPASATGGAVTLPFKCNYFRISGITSAAALATYLTYRVDGTNPVAITGTPAQQQGVVQFSYSGVGATYGAAPNIEERVIKDGFTQLRFYNGEASNTAVVLCECGYASEGG